MSSDDALAPSGPDPSAGTPAGTPGGRSRGVRDRTAWLLRVNRLQGGDGQWATASRFTAAFRGGCWSRPVSESTISRWETGQVRAPHLAVRRYEELLELPPGTLVAVIDTVNRFAGPGGTAAPELVRAGPEPEAAAARLEQLMDLACSQAEMSGPLWDELTTLLSWMPHVRLVPSRAWDQLAGRLVGEMVIADWVAWMYRFEALNRLLNHPVGQVHAIDACASVVADRTSQVVVEVISALDSTPHPDAGRHVLEQLANPTTGSAGYGALLACVRKTRQRHFPPAQNRRLASLLADLLGDPEQAPSVRPLAADILRQLPDRLPMPVQRRLSAATALPSVGHVLDGGLLVPLDSAGTASGRLTHQVLSLVPGDPGPAVTAPLRGMVEELLFSPSPDTRLFVAMLLGSTPYRSALGSALGQRLGNPDVLADPDQSHALFAALRILGGRRERRLVERLALDHGPAVHVPQQAVHALGHIGGESPVGFWLRAIARHGDAWRRRLPGATQTLESLVYALGMARQDRMLAMMRADPTAPDPVRAAAAWWLNIPRQVASSARQ
jgi:hypothetical protein